MKKCILFLSSILSLSFSAGINKKLITVTTKPYEPLVQELAGEGYEVKAFVPKGVDAHHFQPTMARVQAHEGSLWFGTGEPLERHLKKSDDFIDLAKGVPGHHPWLDPLSLKAQLARVKEVLSERYPADKARFELGYNRVAGRLDALDAKIRGQLERSKPLLAYHPSLDAFCDRYKVELITLEEEGKGASQKRLSNAASRARTLGIKALIVDPDHASAKRIAEQLELDLAILDPYCEDVFESIEKAAKLAQL